MLDLEHSDEHEDAVWALQRAEAAGWEITPGKREGVWVAERRGTKRYGIGVIELAQNLRAGG